MLPDLGQYAATVLGAYGVTIALLVLVVGASVRRSARVKRELTALEAQVLRKTDGKP